MKKRKNTVDVLYALMDRNGNYSKLMGTSICSLLETTKARVTLHIFHDGNIKGRNREYLERLAQRYHCRMLFYSVRELVPEIFAEAERILPKAIKDCRFTEAALYRLLAPQLLPEEVQRLIYLDADTIVNLDIQELWQEEIVGGLAAVREIDVINYFHLVRKPPTYPTTLEELAEGGVNADNCFNSGVLLMDLVKMRSMGNLLLSGLQVLTKISDETNFYDQLILNYYFARDMKPLPARYNLLQYWDRLRHEKDLAEGIYHFSAHTLKFDPKDPRDTLYWKYFLMTPWADAEFFCRFNSEMEALYKRSVEVREQKLKRMLSLWGERKLVVAYAEEMEEKVRKLFSAGACFLSLGKGKSLQLRFVYDVDSHFYLLFVPDYVRVNAMLGQAGLKEGEQYGNGAPLLEDKPGDAELITIQEFFESL